MPYREANDETTNENSFSHQRSARYSRSSTYCDIDGRTIRDESGSDRRARMRCARKPDQFHQHIQKQEMTDV